MKGVLAVLLIAPLLPAFHSVPRETRFSGMAGPYPLNVAVELPGVIPGRARIVISFPKGIVARRVLVQPLYWNIPAERAPAPDQSSAISAGEYVAHLWLMVSGSYGVRVIVDGDQGEGIAVVPVSAVAYERLPMTRPLALLLGGLATFLAVGMITIVRAATRESTVQESEISDRRARRRGWIGVAAGCAVAVFVFAGGRAWWETVDRTHRARLFRPSELHATIGESRPPAIHLAMVDSLWRFRRRQWPLVADEGSLLHIFLLADSGAGVAHLHPFNHDSTSFDATLPRLPAGSYHVYAEFTDSTGFTQVVSDALRIPGFPNAITSRPENSMNVDWHRERGWVFNTQGSKGKPLSADLILLRSNGEIVHVRPWGTVSAASVTHFTPAWSPPDLTAGEVSFPYPAGVADIRRAWLEVTAGGKSSVAELTLRPS